MKRAFIALALVATACSNSGSDGPPTSPPTSGPVATAVETTTTSTTTTAAPSTTTATTTTTQPPAAPTLVPRITVTGPEEIVFDWTTDQCEPEHIPDIAARAFRDADGQVQLIIGHYSNYRMIGPDLDNVVTDCSGPTLVSDYDPDPSQFNDSEWIGSTYTLDGETIYAVIHNEYRGDTHDATNPGHCPSSERLTCLDTSLTMAISTDGGDTYADIAPAPGHLIATLPYTFDDEGLPTGLRQPSNIIEGPDGFFYLFSNISDYPREEQWVCAMRTDDLADPGAWRYWDGSGFTGELKNPYVEDVSISGDKCAPLDLDDLSGGVQETVVYDEALEAYVMMGVTFHQNAPEPHFGVYYSLSDNLIEWSARSLLLEVPVTPTVEDTHNDMFFAYPSVIDPDSTSMNFETTDGEAYLYMTRLNAGGSSLDRDLVRWPIRMEYALPQAAQTEWTFDAGIEGWIAENGLTALEANDGSLVMESTFDDPYFSLFNTEIPARYNELGVRMSVSGNGGTVTGQIFFGTDTSMAHTEDNSVVFRANTDGEFHDYLFDMSSLPGWDGTITSLRIDPAPDAGRTIEVDRIWMEEG